MPYLKKEYSASAELLTNILVFGLGAIGTKLIMFVLLPIYTSYMTTDQLGVAELVVNNMNLIYPFATVNILSALLRYEMDGKQDKRKVFQNTFLVLVFGFSATGTVLHFVEFSGSVGGWKRYLVLLMVVYALQQTSSVLAKASGKTKTAVIGNIIYTITLFMFSCIFLVILDRGTAGYLDAMILANIVAAIYMCFAVRLKEYLFFGKIDTGLLKEMVFFSVPLIANSVSWWIASYVDRFVLDYYLGPESVGIYSVSTRIPAIISTVVGVFMQAWVLSAIKEYEAKKDTDFFSAILQKFGGMLFSWAAMSIFLCKWLMQLLVGSSFAESWKYVPLLLGAEVFAGMGAFYSAFYTSAKKNVSVMVSTIIGAVINMVLNFVIIPRVGIQGAVITTLFSQMIVMVYRMIGSGKLVRLEVNRLWLILNFIFILAECFFLLLSEKAVLAGIAGCAVFMMNGRILRNTARSLWRNVRCR